jgi:hypothetical protein
MRTPERPIPAVRFCQTLKVFLLGILPVAVLCVLLSGVPWAGAADKKNCLMCHKHRYIGRIDESGKRWNYNVDEAHYSQSVHRNVDCDDCHSYITKIPHDPVTRDVDCATQCHIKPPFAQDKFSHEKIVEIYNGSAHGIRTDDGRQVKAAKPYCKFCHENPAYSRIPETEVSYEETLRRCLNCHPQTGVVQAYKHITHRLRKKTSRSSREIVTLCAKCHQDEALMKPLKVTPRALEAVATYNQSIHGKLVRLGSQKAADCISCHASNALHDIYKKDSPRATINKTNIDKTCRQCHEKTNRWFIEIAVHPSPEHKDNPIIHLMSIFLQLAIYGTVISMVGLMTFETFGRRREGIRLLLVNGTSWRARNKSTRQKDQ